MLGLILTLEAMLCLAVPVRRGTGAGLVAGFRDLVRTSLLPPRRSGVEVADGLDRSVAMSRGAALAVLDTESQLDFDVLASDEFKVLTPRSGFVTMNLFT